MEIDEIMIKRISKIGNGSHIVLTKKHLNKKAYVIVFSDDLEDKNDKLLINALKKIDKRLKKLEVKNMYKINSITRVKGKNKKGDLILGKTEIMKQE